MKLMDKIKKNKLLYFLGVLIIGVFIVLIVRVTYAFLGANINEARENVVVDSDTTDNLQFSIGDPLVINATPTTLPENGANLVDESVATATLLANSTNDTAEYSYYVYFTISNNTFTYTDGSTPEIILTVTGPDGNPVTNIEGLTYGTFNGVAGFDVTTQNGKFTVASNYAITASSSTDATKHDWTFTLTYLNLSFDQSGNYGNSMTTEISMTKEENIPTLADLCSGKTFAECITTEVYTTDGADGLYYHDGTGTYTNADQEAGDNSYRFAGANPNNYVCFGAIGVDCQNADNLYRIIGVFGDEVKLIKWDYANSDLLGTGGAYSSGTYSASSYGNYNGAHSTVNIYYWNIGIGGGIIASTIWSESILNTMHLNGTYLNNIGSTWQNKIATHSWKVGGASWDNMYNGTPRTAYNYEVGANSSSTTYSAKIGLMYVSDYGFAAIPDYWTSTLVDYYYLDNASTFSNNNWMYMGMREWTISRLESAGQNAFAVYDNGYISYNDVYDSMSESAVRPVFYLESNVELSGGTGTSSDPYRLAV